MHHLPRSSQRQHPSSSVRAETHSASANLSMIRRLVIFTFVVCTFFAMILMLSPAGDEFFSFFGIPVEIGTSETVRRQVRRAVLERHLKEWHVAQQAGNGGKANSQYVGIEAAKPPYFIKNDPNSFANSPRSGFMLDVAVATKRPTSAQTNKFTEILPTEAEEPIGEPITEPTADYSTTRERGTSTFSTAEESDNSSESEVELAATTGPITTAPQVVGGSEFKAKLDLFPTFDYDKSITEIISVDNRRDGIYYNVPASKAALEAIKAHRAKKGTSSEDEASDALRSALRAMSTEEISHYSDNGLPFKGDSFLTTNDWRGKCFYEAHNFCVLNGTMTFFHRPSENPNIAGGSLRMCTEFSQHSPTIRLKYETRPLPADGILPAPLMTKTPAWILQYWCQDMFHMTLTMLPAFQTKIREFPKLLSAAGVIRASSSVGGDDGATVGGSRYVAVEGGGHDGKGVVPPWWGPSVEGDYRAESGDDAVIHPDVFIRIAKGKRKKSAHCRVKLGDPRNWEDVRNSKWNDKQFPIAGNPYWPFYQTLTPQPDRIYPLYRGATAKSACYTNGIIDKYYIKNMMGDQAREYTAALISALNVTKGPKRRCGKYRLTLIDRRGRTRKLTNIAEIASAASAKGFSTQAVAFETLPIRKQLELITSTDVLMGMHGNGITWLQFLPPGSAVVELVGVWYTPYALLWGHKHFHSSMKNNMPYKQGGEFKPFAHNVTEIEELLDKVRAYLDSTSCAKGVAGGGQLDFKPPNEKLENLYKDCAPHC